MTDNVQSMMLEILKRIQADMSGLKTDVADIKARVERVEARMERMEPKIERLDEKFYLEVFQPRQPRPVSKKKVRV